MARTRSNCQGRRRAWRGCRLAAAAGAIVASGMALTAFLPAPPPARGPLEPLPPAVAAVAGLSFAASAQAQSAALDMRDLSPETFKPVCPASDGLYGLGKAFADGLLGAEGAEYRPLAIE
ncbi:unnamed protein product, partial [Symbiodinium sp. CCMP2456]